MKGRSPYVKGATAEERLTWVAMEANPHVIKILDQPRRPGDTLSLSKDLLGFLIPFVLTLLSKPVPPVNHDPYAAIDRPEGEDLRLILRRRLAEAKMEDRFVAITTDDAERILTELEGLNRDQVEAIITDTCDKFFRMKQEFQGYEGLQLTLRVFADRVRGRLR
jgi:hypothetical protein